MESNTITLSQMADMIIVISFFSVGFTAFLYLVVDTILDMISGIKAKRKVRKERKGDEAYANAWFINANSTTKPGVVDADRNPILDSSELYSGIIGRASISFYAFNSNGNRGIACGLNNLQKLADGTPLGGHSRAEDDFADDDDDEDFLG